MVERENKTDKTNIIQNYSGIEKLIQKVPTVYRIVVVEGKIITECTKSVQNFIGGERN